MNNYDYTQYLLTTDHSKAKLRYTKHSKGVLVEWIEGFDSEIIMISDNVQTEGKIENVLDHLLGTYPSDHIIYQLIVNKLTRKGY